MSSHLCYFKSASGFRAVALPFDLDSVLFDWSELRLYMTKDMPGSFRRDEWAYLISFLDKDNLMLPFINTFGSPLHSRQGQVSALFRPRGRVALWLPNNVILLGPLMLILLSLTGNTVYIKTGSRSEDLTGVFFEFASKNLPEGELKHMLQNKVKHEVFERDDPRNKEMAAQADVRIVFGSDEAAESIHALPHPLESVGFSFVDRRSEAWLEKEAISKETLIDLIKVFTIYGQAGCTSPSRVVLLDAGPDEVLRLRDDLLDLWPKVITHDPPIHIASANVLSQQLSAALGWNSRLTKRNSAVLACGTYDLPEFAGPMALSIVASSLENALEHLPSNIQTLGHAVKKPEDDRWIRVIAQSRVRRFVPILQMHHFGPIWDGYEFWLQTFEEVEMKL